MRAPSGSIVPFILVWNSKPVLFAHLLLPSDAHGAKCGITIVSCPSVRPPVRVER